MLRRTRRSLHITRAVPLRLAPVSLPDGFFMKTHKFDYKATAAAFAIVIPICVALWMLAVPTTMAPVTFVAVTFVMIGGTVVALNTWANGRPTRTIAHVLNDAEGPAPRE
jgi:hypothetical protein